MKIIFNKDGNGSRELHRLTGSFPAGSNFDSICSDIELETETVVRFVGRAVYDRALDSYHSDHNERDSDLIRLVQRPIALFATLRYLQSNLTDHDESGRKVKVSSEGEKMAFEWQVDRDDHARLHKAYKALDMLLMWLEQEQLPEWIESDQFGQRRDLIVSSLEQFERVYYIDGSYRFFYILCPLLREVQSQMFEGDIDSSVLGLARAAVVLKTMSIAIGRFSISILPEGVVKRYSPPNQTSRASESAKQEVIEKTSRQLAAESDEYLSRISVKLNNGKNPYADADLKPINSVDNKFFSL